MGIRIIDPEMVERCAFALFAVDYPSAPETAWAALTATARHAYAARALAVLEEALRSPLVDVPGEVSAVSAAVKVRTARYGGIYDALPDGECGARASWRDWIVDTSSGCGCEIGGFTGCEPTRVYADLGHALDFAREHAETHTCPSWRASGERCTTFCTDCGGTGWIGGGVMRIFIAGPALGREDTYKAVFAAAADTLRKGGHEPVNPVAIELGENADRADYITAALDALWSADAIYLLPGWRDSDLAQAQARVAELRGMRRFGVTA